jgi:hypothetical protein
MNIQALSKRTKTRYLSRTNELKSSNFTMNLGTLEAKSYNWWIFVRKVNGKVIFNHTTYSQTTCKHQGKALQVLDYKYDLKLRFTRKSLSDLPAALESEVIGAKRAITQLISDIKKPRTQKAKNEERKQSISKLVQHIDLVRKFKSELKEV